MSYRVIKPFKYEGKELNIGDAWRPAGTKFDTVLVESKRYVEHVESPSAKRNATRRKRKAALSAARLPTAEGGAT